MQTGYSVEARPASCGYVDDTPGCRAEASIVRTCVDCASQEASAPASAGTTPSHAATPVSSFPTRESSQPTTNGARNGSKKKKAGDDDDTDGPSAKRNKISYGRE